ncbi:cytidylate kinase [Dethiosulfovibrio peptidovorans DSM 11002]|uniref:Cytidylate kinase n=1 Tax=Dethiosulfovibrio peptidovorans DSM 11002 TaxID=469381 RepID=D2Z4L6_9BACT|nr:(d)CMP kinase [Dethiosulfovibrio peptidovorans]EFC92360.1 cytidylate kinase [Dethiosulfovibrio peptidovorans DSM 11002]
MASKNIVITVDGPAGAGKSTVARRVASELGIPYLDTGALYRALAYILDSRGIPPEEGEDLNRSLRSISVLLEGGRVTVDDVDVTDMIRTPRVDSIASSYSALPSVRDKLLDLQREQALSGGLVADGRDMGTVVFPLAPLKVYLSASEETRADRRWRELREKGEDFPFDSILEDIRRRDRADMDRACSPLRKAADSVLIDSSDMTIDEVVAKIVSIASEVRHD